MISNYSMELIYHKKQARLTDTQKINKLAECLRLAIAYLAPNSMFRFRILEQLRKLI